MKTEQRINRREFIRNFKKYQLLLASRQIQSLCIILNDDKELDVRLKTKGSTGRDIARFVRGLRKPIVIKRPHFELFS
jgi:hypothetical protein